MDIYHDLPHLYLSFKLTILAKFLKQAQVLRLATPDHAPALEFENDALLLSMIEQVNRDPIELKFQCSKVT